MKFPLTVFVFLLTVISSLSVDITVRGTEGEPVIIKCPYPGGYRNYYKYFYKGPYKKSEIILRSDGRKSEGRFSLKDDRKRSFTVTIRNLKMEDAGLYGCRAGAEHYKEVNLIVIRAPQSPRPVQNSSSNINQYTNTSTEHSSTEHSSTEHTSTEHSSTEHTSTEHSSTEHSSTEHTSTEHSSTEHTSTEHSSTEHNSTEHTSTEYSSTEHTSTEYSSTEHSSTEHTSIEHTSTEHSSTEHTSIEHTSTEHSSTEHTSTVSHQTETEITRTRTGNTTVELHQPTTTMRSDLVSVAGGLGSVLLVLCSGTLLILKKKRKRKCGTALFQQNVQHNRETDHIYEEIPNSDVTVAASSSSQTSASHLNTRPKVSTVYTTVTNQQPDSNFSHTHSTNQVTDWSPEPTEDSRTERIYVTATHPQNITTNEGPIYSVINDK